MEEILSGTQTLTCADTRIPRQRDAEQIMYPRDSEELCRGNSYTYTNGRLQDAATFPEEERLMSS
jgi:hypothetical protein